MTASELTVMNARFFRSGEAGLVFSSFNE